MPWLAVPFDQIQIKEKLSSILKIQGIPALVVLDAKTGFFVTNDARNDVVAAAGNITKAEAVISSWKAKEAVPIELASFAENTFSLATIFTYFMRNPIFIILLYYAFRKLLAMIAEV